jgi:hypothetical protein
MDWMKEGSSERTSLFLWRMKKIMIIALKSLKGLVFNRSDKRRAFRRAFLIAPILSALGDRVVLTR